MLKVKIVILALGILMLNIQCSNSKKKTLKPLVKEQKTEEEKNDTLKNLKKLQEKEEKTILLNDQNAIPFFFNYQKKNLEDKVRISTRFGDIDIQLYKNTPYHRANFIYLTKK